MKPATKAKINQIARLMWNGSHGSKIDKDIDFSTTKNVAFTHFWNMALIAYVECFPKHRDLLRYKI